MSGSPAGWHDDPEEPEQRGPGHASPTATSRRWLWITLSVLGVVVVLVIVAVVALAASGDDTTDVLEKDRLPPLLEANLAANGLDVTVTRAECDDVSSDDGPFTTTCEISIEGLSTPLDATAYGSIDGTEVDVEDVQSDTNLLDAELAAEQTQSAITALDPTVEVVSCTLPETVVKVSDGLTFTCDLSSDETVTLEVEDGGLTITDVS